MKQPEDIIDSKAAWRLLALLTCSYALAYIDRQLLNLVVDPVKRTLDISDTRFSFIQGAAFILAYVSASPLFGRLVDITNRRNILVGGICAWSLCTAMCGLAGTFWTLAAARFGVGVSEACVFPVAMSLIPELFSARRLPRALSFFALGAQIGGGFSLLAGGTVLAFAALLVKTLPVLRGLQDWQLAFVIVGLPGLGLVAILLCVPEPVRRTGFGDRGSEAPFPLRLSIAKIWERRAFYGRIFLFCAGNGLVFLSVPSWYPTFLIRVFHLPPATVGLHVGLITLLFGGGGTLLGPVVTQKLLRRGYEDAPLRAAAGVSLGSILCCLTIPYAPTAIAAQALFAGIIFCCAFPTSLVAFALQRPTPGRMRGLVASMYTFTSQTIGYGIGPTLIAVMNDRIFHDPLKVGSSIQIVCGGAAIVVSIALASNLKHYRRMISGLAPLAGEPERAVSPQAQPAPATGGR